MEYLNTENMIYILFICITIPLILSVPLIQKASRDIMVCLIIGIFAALFISEVNGIFLRLFHEDVLFVTTTITPVTEEIIKALPVIVFAFLFSENRAKLLSISFALGVGFALFENTFILIENVQYISLGWAAIRGFSSALMHGVCTAAVGYGMSYVRIKRKLSIPGTFALLITVIMYHGIFNMMVQAENMKNYGFLLPAATYIPFLIYLLVQRNKVARQKLAQEQTE